MGMSGGVKLTPQQPRNTSVFWVMCPARNLAWMSANPAGSRLVQLALGLFGWISACPTGARIVRLDLGLSNRRSDCPAGRRLIRPDFGIAEAAGAEA